MPDDKQKKRTEDGKSGVGNQLAARRRNRGHSKQADWGEADAKLLLRLVAAIAKIGGAVQFGYTQSGDSYVIRVLGDGEPFNEYLRSTEDIDLWIEGFVLDYELDETRPEGG